MTEKNVKGADAGGQDELMISDMEQVEVKTGAAAAAAEEQDKNALESFHDGFEGLGKSGFAKRVVIDGTQLLFKESGAVLDSITIRLKGGRAVKQLFIEESNTMIKSYDGKKTTDGEPVSMYPGLKDQFELDFDWPDHETNEHIAHQMTLSPSSTYAFDDYAAALKDELKKAKKEPKRLNEVDTIITVIRSVSGGGIRYSKAQFTCKELQEIGWAPKVYKKK